MFSFSMGLPSLHADLLSLSSWSPLLKTYPEPLAYFNSALLQLQRSNLWASSCRNTSSCVVSELQAWWRGWEGWSLPGKKQWHSGTTPRRPQVAGQTGALSGRPLGSKHLIGLREGRQRKETTALLPGCSFHQLLRSLREAKESRSAGRCHTAMHSTRGELTLSWQVFVSTENIHSWSRKLEVNQIQGAQGAS